MDGPQDTEMEMQEEGQVGQEASLGHAGWLQRWHLLGQEDKALCVGVPYPLTWLVPSQEGPAPKPSISGSFPAIHTAPRSPPSAHCLSLVLRNPFASPPLGSRP